MAKTSTFNVALKLLTQQFNKGIKDVQRQIKGFSNFVKGAFAIGSITAFGRQVVQVAAEFEDSMARVRAVSNASNHELKIMADEAKRLGANTRYTASEAANALENLTRNGLSAADATKTLEGVLKLAQANAIGLAQAADIVTNTLNIFGMSAEEVTRVNDVLSATCANSATDITLLAEAIVGVGPVAKIMGKSIEETAAAIGTLANRGVKGSEAGRALAAMYSRLANQSPKASAALKRYGIEVDEAKLKSQTLTETLDMLAKSGVGDSVDALADIFGNNYYKILMSLINAQEDFNNMLNATTNAAGTTERMFKQGVGSTKEAMDTLKSTWESFLNDIGNKTSGVFIGVIRLLTNFIKAMKNTGTAITTVVSVAVAAIGVKLSRAIITARDKAIAANASLTVLKATIAGFKAVCNAAKVAMGGWVGILLTVASVIIPMAVNGIHKFKEEHKSLETEQAAATAEAEKEAVVLNKLHDIAADSTKAISVRKKALQDIKSTVKDYHGDLDAEGKLINDNTDAIANYIEALKAQMLLEVKEARLKELIEKKEIAAAEALAAAQEKPNFWKKVGGVLMTGAQASREGQMAGMGEVNSPAVNAAKLQGAKIEKLNNKVKQIEKEINDFSDTEIAEAVKAVATITNSTGGGGGDGGGGGKSDLQKAKEKLANAIIEYNNDLVIAKNKFMDGIITSAEENDLIIRAEESLLDAYYDAAQSITDRDVREDDMFKKVLESYKARVAAGNALAQAEKEQAEADKKFKDNALKKAETQMHAIQAMTKSINEYEQGGKKSSNANPWEQFSTNPKEYRDEELALAELEDELTRLQRTYDDCSEEVTKLQDSMFDEAEELIAKYKELGDLLPEQIKKVEEARNSLYSKKAQDEIIALNQDKLDAQYNSIKATTNAVGTLVTSIESLATADWGKMSIGEIFSTVTNAIFGTIDAINSCIDSFKSLNEIIDALNLAQKTYAAASAASAAATVGSAEAETLANTEAAVSSAEKGEAALLAAGQEVAAAETTVAANTAEAVTGAAASQAGIPIAGPILAAAAVAGILALLATSIPKFATGGVVQGGSRYGDKMLARVNSGEMILNNQQQKRLFDMANGKGSGSGQVSFHIAGKDLVGVLRNNNTANSKIQSRL